MPPALATDMSLVPLWILAFYGVVIGLKFTVLRRGDVRTLGIGLLLASLGWMLLARGIEVEAPLTVTLPEGGKQVLDIPVLRTLAARSR